MTTRFKREECRRTKHDAVFSKWEILIGPFDWEDYSLGKDGVERYRIYNLPLQCSRSGLYELGIAATTTNEDRKIRKHAPDDIIAVYLGQADNVRTRLQQYGRAGSHLDHGNSITSPTKYKSSCLQRGPGLFREIFSRGYSIMFRWAPMISKNEAEKMEARLLAIFDYAWNTLGNGACRRDDILFKLDKKSIRSVLSILKKLQNWTHSQFAMKVGIKINASMPQSKAECSDLSGFLIPGIRKCVKTQPRRTDGGSSLSGYSKSCGVLIDDGSVCRNMPASGRKRCLQHKGMRIASIESVTVTGIAMAKEIVDVCGVFLLDGSICLELPMCGRKRCQQHRGRSTASYTKAEGLQFSEPYPVDDEGSLIKTIDNTVLKPQQYVVQETYNDQKGKYPICGVVLGDGLVCRNKPSSGRKRCELHKGQRLTGTRRVAKIGD